jgi:hypothetical protein
MAQRWQFSDIYKEYFQLRGELQNNTVTGVNADEVSMCKKLINREYQELAAMRPPFLQKRWNITLQPSVDISITGHKNVPEVTNTAATLKWRDVYRVITDGSSYRHTITGISSTGSKYYLDNPLTTVRSTATTVTAYKMHYPLPHDLGNISNIFYEDSEEEIKLVSRPEFDAAAKRDTNSRSRICSDGIFTNTWSPYKFQVTGTSIKTNSRKVVMAANNGVKFNTNDVILARNKFLYTVVGVATTANTLFIDRDWTSTTTCATILCNPREHTRYLSLYYIPDEEESIVINGWVKPPDMVADSDICMFPDTAIPAIIIGALLRDKFGFEIVTKDWMEYYERVKKTAFRSTDAKVFDGISAPQGWGGRTGMTSQFSSSSFRTF